jgi:hypothetical protein
MKDADADVDAILDVETTTDVVVDYSVEIAAYGLYL